MSVWLLVQVTINLALILGLFSLWNKFRKSKDQEDPRLSRGLQLLQSKISILEDLSDRTEVQVKQVTALLNNKLKEIHEKIEVADTHVRTVDRSIEKSLEVSKIFQDKIPHQEIIERQTTAKYIDAARLAHSGLAIEEIAKQVEIPRGELELIVRMNRQQMVMSETDIPSWARSPQVDLEFKEPAREKAPEQDLDGIRERLRAQSNQSFKVSTPQEVTAPVTRTTAPVNQVPPQVRVQPTMTAATVNFDSGFSNQAQAPLDLATEILENQLKAEKPVTRLGSLMKKSSIVEPGSTEIKPYSFKKIDKPPK